MTERRPITARAPGPAASHETLRERLRALEVSARPLEPDAAERSRLREAVIGSSERFLGAIDELPAFEEPTASSGPFLAGPIVDEGLPIDELLGLYEDQVVRPGAHPASPGHLAFIASGGLYHAALADYLAAVGNKFGGLFFTGPGLVRMENQMVRWAADLLGYPASAGGAILSGGSLANLTAITAARDAHGVLAGEVSSAVIYATGQAHHSIDKALRIAGLAGVERRTVAMDARYRMCPEALAETIAADRARDLRPWLIVATAGSTDCGAVDPLDALADVAAREGCWLHVDAAYGGFFLMTGHGKRVLRGIERSHSAVLDPHKSLFLPWGAGMVVARDVETLAAVHGATGSYLQDAARAGEVSPADVSPELTKPFRALRLWLPLAHLGLAPFRAALEEKLLLARYFREKVRALGFEVGPPPDLSIVTYRWAPAGVAPEEADRMNRAIVDGVRREGSIFLSSTSLDGRFTLRMAALGHRTHLATIDRALEILSEQVGAGPVRSGTDRLGAPPPAP